MSAPSFPEDHDALLEAAARSRDQDEKVRLLEAAVRLADHHGDEVRGFWARDRIIHDATFGGQPDKALVAFAWCRARYLADAQRYQSWHFLWRNKWVVNQLPEHLGVTRAQILEAQDDYGAALEQRGGNVKSIAKLRLSNAMIMGDYDEVRRWHPVWRDASRDFNADCRACDLDTEVELSIRLGEDQQALDQAAPILDGRLRCAEVPHLTLPWLTQASFRLGRLQEAVDLFARGYRMVRHNRDFLSAVGRYLAFLALTDNHGPALTLVERHLAWALETRSALAPVNFHLAARFLFERIAAAGQDEIAVDLPRSFPLHRDQGLYVTRALHDWFDARITDLSTRFDARNENAFYTTQLERSRRWAEEARPFPVTRGLG